MNTSDNMPLDTESTSAIQTTEATKLAIYVGDSERHGHKPLYHAIIELLRQERIAGATVLHGIECYGTARHGTSTQPKFSIFRKTCPSSSSPSTERKRLKQSSQKWKLWCNMASSPWNVCVSPSRALYQSKSLIERHYADNMLMVRSCISKSGPILPNTAQAAGETGCTHLRLRTIPTAEQLSTSLQFGGS